MKDNGTVASIGLAQSPEVHTWVMPFILRGVSLLGINSGESVPPEVRAQVWRRLAGDMKPPLLGEMARTVAFGDLPKAFDDFIDAKVSRRVVVDLNE
jgi:acrylyl-CoA reductase (NADPH)